MSDTHTQYTYAELRRLAEAMRSLGATYCSFEIDEVLALLDQCETAEKERDAYKKAKEENDDRFMRERDEARHELAQESAENYRSMLRSAVERIEERDAEIAHLRMEYKAFRDRVEQLLHIRIEDVLTDTRQAKDDMAKQITRLTQELAEANRVIEQYSIVACDVGVQRDAARKERDARLNITPEDAAEAMRKGWDSDAGRRLDSALRDHASKCTKNIGYVTRSSYGDYQGDDK